MDFVKAIRLAVKGKPIRRRTWKFRGSKLQRLTESVGFDGRLFWQTNLPSEGGRVICDFIPSIEDILAGDWMEIKQ